MFFAPDYNEKLLPKTKFDFMKSANNFCGIIALLLTLPFLSFSNTNPTISSSFEFFAQKLNVKYNPDMFDVEDVCIKQKCFKRFYEAMEKKPYKELLKDLQEYQKQLKLNDWLTYKMTKMAVNEILKKSKDELQKGFTTWFLLTEMGYDIRVAVTDQGDPFLYAKTEEAMGTVPSFTDGDYKFVNLTAVDFKVDTKKIELYKPEFIANRKGKAFQFHFTTAPEIKSKAVDKSVTFTYKDKEYTLNFKVDQTYAEEMANYPRVGAMGFMNAPLSETTQSTLLPELKEMMEGKSNEEALEVLVAFTRTGFKYKSDWNIYDDEHPMFAEEVFMSEYSDHEDRSALLYFLIKETLDLPMIVITHYNYNTTIGVELDGDIKRPYEYKGKNYVICDPMTPTSTSAIGKWPNGMTNNTAKVVGKYR